MVDLLNRILWKTEKQAELQNKNKKSSTICDFPN